MSLSTLRRTGANAEMDESILAFQEMMCELPDFDQELALQAIGKFMDVFTLFQKLPVEVRLMVWKLTFPRGRKLRIRRMKQCKHAEDEDLCTCVPVPQHVDLPVALFVNKESRNETLKHYQVIFYDPRYTPSRNGSPQPLCVNNTKDILYIKFRADTIARYAAAWFHLLARKNPGSFDEVKVLEIRDWYMPFDTTFLGSYYYVLFVLDLFPNLEELRVCRIKETHDGDEVIPRAPRMGDPVPWTDIGEQVTIMFFSIYFKNKEEENVPGYKAPHFSIHPWSRIEMQR